MKILKFGGSSVAKPDRINGVVSILKKYAKKEERFSVVFSAFGGVTDQLIEMSRLAGEGEKEYETVFDEFSKRHHLAVKELITSPLQEEVLAELKENHEMLKNLLHGVYLVREASPRTMDYVLSFGERNAAFIISHVLRQHGLEAHYLDARKIIKTDKQFGSAKVDLEQTYQHIDKYYREHPGIHIVTGFISAARGGLTTTLGRGGSDYTAALLAAGLDASIIEIWTDVDGVLTADPRKVKPAFTIPEMTYAEAMEMSHFGAKVIYPPTLQPALSKNIPLTIRNTFNPEFSGTLISEVSSKNGHAVRGISSIGNIALLTLQGGGLFGVPGIAARLFSALAQANINVILITQGSSEHTISFAIQPQYARKAKKRVEAAFEYELNSKLIEPIKVEDDLSVIAIIGENMRYQPGISGRLFQSLGKNGINCIAIAQGSSELNISVVIPRSDEGKALNALHESFFLSDVQELHVFMVGVGLIGSTLLAQIKKQNNYLKENRHLVVKIVGLSNSRKMVFDTNGIDLSNWKNELADAPDKMVLDTFIKRMKKLNLPNTIFVDNTANESIALEYSRILDASISISTPNKIATSSAYIQYQRLKALAEKRGVKFLYETNVGAGLPIISTLNDLITSGDEILKIEGVLSGSLSFIFNSFRADQKFSDIIRRAADLGFTEPDPRVDLKGIDVRRKLIILARETGLPLEAKDVVIESILPPACIAAESVEDFFNEVENANTYFEERRAKAAEDGKVLRMVASLEGTAATINLQAVGPEHPFYGLDGSDNMIVFTTQRYKDRPLVIRGPGAGAEVTAAGVFAEIVAIGNSLQK